MARHTGMVDRVRAAAKELDRQEGFSKSDLYHHIDGVKPLNSLGERSFNRTWRELRKRGELKRIGYARYRFIAELTPRADIRQKVYRAIYIKGAFCAKDIVLLTDAEHSYILAIIGKLKKAGYLEYTGMSEKSKFFRVCNLNKFYLELVHPPSSSATARHGGKK